MREVTIVAYNYGPNIRFVNGPGMCLDTFVKYLRESDIKVNLFSYLNGNMHAGKIRRAISRSDIFHQWSGTLNTNDSALFKHAKTCGAKIVLGPNLLDTVELKKEVKYLKVIGDFDLLLTVNERLKFKLARTHDISLKKIKVLMIGPDLDLWKPSAEDNGKILWKGASNQHAKDIKFGLELANSLPQYEFDFMGHPNRYDYLSHIKEAKDYHLYVSTSISETMGLALAEQWAAGVPSVTHPKVYLHGENYRTGISVNRTQKDYCDAIIEIMEDHALHRQLSFGAREYMLENFSKEKIAANYRNICSTE